MINEDLLLSLKKWFSVYTSSFKSNKPYYNMNFHLKINHTYRVCFEILNIAKHAGLNKDDINLSEIIALFHDIGRFEQFMTYGTFMDGRSVNHALLGIKVLNNNYLLNKIPAGTRKTIYKSIFSHNKLFLPDNADKKELIFIKLIRDADKLDILYQFSDYYSKKEEESNPIAELELPDGGDISDEIYVNLLKRQPIKYSSLNNLIEFKLLKFSWIYDINFLRSFQIIKENGYLDSIYKTLPKTKKIEHIYERVNEYLDKKLSNQPLKFK
ncbi:MAG: HD domain-containing protein [Spirochaetes bacterium]|nr:HD domain-containing protein [Spirochaetota bacterium]